MIVYSEIEDEEDDDFLAKKKLKISEIFKNIASLEISIENEDDGSTFGKYILFDS